MHQSAIEAPGTLGPVLVVNAGCAGIRRVVARRVHMPWEIAESIDGYYLSKRSRKLFLFQITRSSRHPIKANGVRKSLVELGMYDSLQSDEVVLFFLIPKQMETYKAQEFVFPNVAAGESPNVSQVYGIGRAAPLELSVITLDAVAQLTA